MENQEIIPQPALKPRMGSRLNRIFTSAAIALLAVLSWQAYDTRQIIHSLQTDSNRRQEQDNSAAQQARTLARRSQEAADALQAKLGGLEVRLQEIQEQNGALQALHTDFARMRDERSLAEVEQAVLIAEQQLQFSGNVPAALAALQGADHQLALLDQSRFLPVRKLIARDIERLKALPTADLNGLVLQLDSIVGRVDTLALGFAHQPEAMAEDVPPAKPAVAEAWTTDWFRQLGRDLWGEFRQLVRIERMDQPDAALLPPDQSAYLRENLRLRLLMARVALLQREGKVFAENLRQSREWLQRYFDMKTRPVSDSVAELAKIEKAHVNMSVPSLADTQAALRQAKLSQKR